MKEETQGPNRSYSRLVQRLLTGGIPQGRDFDACRAVLHTSNDDEAVFHALCIVLEGALAEPTLGIDETQTLVRLLKELARKTVTAKELL